MLHTYYDNPDGEIFIYNNNAYFFKYPFIENEPELIEENVVYYTEYKIPDSRSYRSKQYDDLLVVYKDGSIKGQITGLNFYLKDAFKLSVYDSSILCIAPHTILYVDIERGIQFERNYKGFVTDGWLEYCDYNDYIQYLLIVNGKIVYGNNNMTMTMNRRIVTYDQLVSTFEDGFVYNRTFYDIGATPKKVFCFGSYCLAFIHDGLYFFEFVNNRAKTAFLIENIEDIFYSYKEKFFYYYDTHGEINLWNPDDLKELGFLS